MSTELQMEFIIHFRRKRLSVFEVSRPTGARRFPTEVDLIKMWQGITRRRVRISRSPDRLVLKMSKGIPTSVRRQFVEALADKMG